MRSISALAETRSRRSLRRPIGSPRVDFELSDEQRLLRETVRDFARQEVAPVAEELDREKRFPYEIVEKMGGLGLMGIPFPQEYGGGGADTLSYVARGRRAGPGRLLGLHHDRRPHLARDDADPPLGDRRADARSGCPSSAAAGGSPPSA